VPEDRDGERTPACFSVRQEALKRRKPM